VADSCKGDDSDGIDNEYHDKFSDEDWKPDWGIFNGHFLKWKSAFLPQRCSDIYSNDIPTKVIRKNTVNLKNL